MYNYIKQKIRQSKTSRCFLPNFRPWAFLGDFIALTYKWGYTFIRSINTTQRNLYNYIYISRCMFLRLQEDVFDDVSLVEFMYPIYMACQVA